MPVGHQEPEAGPVAAEGFAPAAAGIPDTGAGRPAPRVVGLDQLQHLVGPAEALAAARHAFRAAADGTVTSVAPWQLAIPTRHGEIHVKGAHLENSPYITVKLATGFDNNPDIGLPAGSGFVAVLDATTGRPALLMLDDGYLTDLRTGAAGAVASDLLAQPEVSTVTVVGCGAQARFQIDALRLVRRPENLLVWGRNPTRAEASAHWAADRTGWHVTVAASLQHAVESADLVITVTSSTTPLIPADWLRPGVHVTAVGSDNPAKRELQPEVLHRADVVAVDDLDQSLRLGEMKGLDPGTIHPVSIGDILTGRRPGRTAPDQITVADLTGIGAQDAALAAAVALRLTSPAPSSNGAR